MPAILEAWSSLGVSVSILSDERQQHLLHKMRGAQPSPFAATNSIADPIRRIASLGDYCIVCDWSFSDHAAVLVPSHALVRSTPRLTKIFPNGFLVFDSAMLSGILISIDEDDPNFELADIEFG